ncbi:MAG: choice-of-anchor P family protein [Methylocella sp.]
MNNKSYLHFLIGAVSLLLIDLGLTMPAEANVFTCRASAVRVSTLGLITEPVVANPQDEPCVADTKSLVSLSILGISTGVLNAKTTGSATTAPITAEGSAANVSLLSVLGVRLLTGTAAAVDAKARVDSVGGVCVFSSNSIVTNLNIPGLAHFALLTTPVSIKILGLLGLNLGELFLNATIGGPHPTIGSPSTTFVTQRALWLHLNPVLGLLGSSDVIVGEATADIAFGNPCAHH